MAMVRGHTTQGWGDEACRGRQWKRKKE